MSKGPTRQHYVPQCYLREWAASNLFFQKTTYLWVFNKGERTGRKSAITNVFVEKDLYTLHLKSGEKDFTIEETLSNIEGKYATIFREKIKKHLPLTGEDHVYLCIFVAAMLQRTPRYRDNMNKSFKELANMAKEMEMANGLPPKESQESIKMQENQHKVSMMQVLPDIAKMLNDMSIGFLCATGSSKFVTSDDPCNLFNPDLQWQRFYSPGLAQKNVELTLPLSPEILLCMTWGPLRGYINRSNAEVEEMNRMIIGTCYKYFIAQGSRAKRHWLRSYPLDLFFILKIIKHRILLIWHDLINKVKYHHVRRK